MDLMKFVVNDGEGCLWVRRVPCGMNPDKCWEILTHHPNLGPQGRYTGHAGDLHLAFYFHIKDFGVYFNG